MKYIWIDTETTGLIPGKHAVIQIAAIITETIGGDPIDIFNESGGCHGFEVSAKALKVNGITEKELKKRRKPKHLFRDFITFLGKHVNRYDSNDKLIPVGYNVRFDTDMLFGFAKAMKYPYLGSMISGSGIDIMHVVRWEDACGKLPPMKNHKLVTVAKALGITLDDAHDALADIEATKAIAERLMG